MLHFQGNYLLKQKKQTTAVFQIFRRHNTQGGPDNAKEGFVFLNCCYTISMLIVIVDWFPSFIKSFTSVLNSSIKSFTSVLNERETK